MRRGRDEIVARQKELQEALLRGLEKVGGEIVDPRGLATPRLLTIAGMEVRDPAYALNRLQASGVIEREMRGKRTYRIALVNRSDGSSSMADPAGGEVDGTVPENTTAEPSEPFALEPEVDYPTLAVGVLDELLTRLRRAEDDSAWIAHLDAQTEYWQGRVKEAEALTQTKDEEWEARLAAKETDWRTARDEVMGAAQLAIDEAEAKVKERDRELIEREHQVAELNERLGKVTGQNTKLKEALAKYQEEDMRRRHNGQGRYTPGDIRPENRDVLARLMAEIPRTKG